jgi:hypothetical protein
MNTEGSLLHSHRSATGPVLSQRSLVSLLYFILTNWYSILLSSHLRLGYPSIHSSTDQCKNYYAQGERWYTSALSLFPLHSPYLLIHPSTHPSVLPSIDPSIRPSIYLHTSGTYVHTTWIITNERLYNTSQTNKKKLNSMVRVRERTIPTERPPLVGEVIANFCG